MSKARKNNDGCEMQPTVNTDDCMESHITSGPSTDIVICTDTHGDKNEERHRITQLQIKAKSSILG